MPNRDAIRKKLVYPILSTIEPEYPAEILGMSVINELNIAYCIAVNEIFVSYYVFKNPYTTYYDVKSLEFCSSYKDDNVNIGKDKPIKWKLLK